MVAELASSILDECGDAFGLEALPRLKSHQLLRKMARGFTTGHAAQHTREAVVSEPGLSIPLRVEYVDVGLHDRHPVIFPSAYLELLADSNKLENMTGGKPFPETLTKFWEAFEQLQPKHPIYSLSPESRAYSIPIYLFGDEGRGFKKAGIMILGSEPVLGYGCDAEDEVTSQEILRMNFRGSTYKTRQLYTCMAKKHTARTMALFIG